METNEITEGLFHQLTGYGRGRPEHLERLIAYPRWRERAEAELERRATELIESLDTETLAAVADGSVDIHAVARRALAETKQ